jgi:hypothetical protein
MADVAEVEALFPRCSRMMGVDAFLGKRAAR